VAARRSSSPTVPASWRGHGSKRWSARGQDPPPAPRLVLALPLLQRTHFDTAVTQCVEVGVTEFVPLRAERCHVRAWTPALAARSERVAVAAMKQAGRAWLPPFGDAADVAGLAAGFGAFRTVVLADPGGERLLAAQPAGDTLAIVGPEAGFSEGERERLIAAGARPALLSRNRLRAETAAVVLVSMLSLRA
jgi:16S rRNA (uracil1498-N3)-methyltransferase